MGKTYLITGATGLIGSNLTRKLLSQKGNHVIALGRSEDKLNRVFSDLLDNPNFSYMAHDISVPLPDSLPPVHYLFHAAGPISGTTIREFPVDVILPNLFGLKNCLDYLLCQYRETGIKGRIVLFSSATIYENHTPEDILLSESDTQETDTLEGVNAPYSQTKRMCEIMGRAYQKQYHCDVVIARLGYVYGYTKMPPKTAFYEFIRMALNGKNIVLHSSIFQKRDNIYIDDAIHGLITVCQKGVTGEAYNVTSSGDGNNFAAANEMAQLIARIVSELQNTCVEVKYESDGFRYTPGVCLSNDKLKQLGWSIQYDLWQGIREILIKYRGDADYVSGKN